MALNERVEKEENKETEWVWQDYLRHLRAAGVAVEIVSLRQRHAIDYWDIVQRDLKTLEDNVDATPVGPFAYWNAVRAQLATQGYPFESQIRNSG